MAIGADVFQYGERRGLDFVSNVQALASNVQKSSNEDLIKSKTILVSGVNVTVIGFLGKYDKEKYYGGIKISDPRSAIETEIKEQKKAGKQIFVAIGTADIELATEIAKIDGMNIVIYCGSNVTEGMVRKVTYNIINKWSFLDVDHTCKGGLARMVKSLEMAYPPPTTTTEPTTSTTETTPISTMESTSSTSTTVSTTSTTTNSSLSTNNGRVKECSASTSICFHNNTLFLNAGNYLHSLNNNWFDLLKYGPAKTALNSLPFSAIAIGADVFQYGERRGLDFVSNVQALASNVQKSSNEDLIKSKTILVSGVNVTVIGFLGKYDKEKYYGGIKISDPRSAIETEIKEQKKAGKQIFVAIGTADIELATEIAKIDGMNIVIYCGSNVTEGMVRKVT
ncbi:hypothetical protein J437_LFUL019532 [Ladona fulva]|nr:hypothetical protein J437_LFUL019532 [Ladona fulva]